VVEGNARQEFARRFDLLLRDCGLQGKQVVSRVMNRRPQGASWAVTSGLISAWRTSRNLPSTANNDAFFLVVRVATALARGRAATGHPIGELLD